MMTRLIIRNAVADPTTARQRAGFPALESTFTFGSGPSAQLIAPNRFVNVVAEKLTEGEKVQISDRLHQGGLAITRASGASSERMSDLAFRNLVGLPPRPSTRTPKILRVEEAPAEVPVVEAPSESATAAEAPSEPLVTETTGEQASGVVPAADVVLVESVQAMDYDAMKADALRAELARRGVSANKWPREKMIAELRSLDESANASATPAPEGAADDQVGETDEAPPQS